MTRVSRIGWVVLLFSGLAGLACGSPTPSETTSRKSEALATDGQATAASSGSLTSIALELQVSENACAANLAQDYFEVTNGSGGPVALSDITIKYWINDTSGVAVTPEAWYAGCVTSSNGTCVHPVSGVKATATPFSPACGSDPNHQANWEITVSTTDATPLAAGQTWSNVQTAVNLANYANFIPGKGTWFSGCGSGQPYAPTRNFGLYYQGNPVFSSQGITAPSCRDPMGRQVLNNYTLPPPSTIVGVEPQETPVTVHVGMPLRNVTALQTIVTQASNPRSSTYRQWVTPSTFMENYAPSATEYDQLVAWAEAQGFRVTTYANRLGLNIFGTAAQIEQAFFVNLIEAQRPDGTTFYEPDRQPSINLSLPVEGMSGLDNYFVPKAQNTATQPGVPGTPLLMQSSDLRGAYLGVGSTCSSLTGSGQTIGLVELDDFVDTDVAGAPTSYETVTNLSGVPPVVRETVPGNPPLQIPLGGEVPGDIEMAIAMAPGAQVIAFEAVDVDSSLQLIGQYAMEYPQKLNQVSMSWITALSGHTPTLLTAIASQGVSFFSATSDQGPWQPPNAECPKDVIARVNSLATIMYTAQYMEATDESLPYETLVGGTQFIIDNLPGYTAGLEEAWNTGGGGVFVPAGPNPAIFPMESAVPGIAIPDYQQGANPSNSTVSTVYRNAPDVSATAFNAFFVVAGAGGGLDGTSFSSPLWAGFAALMNEYAMSNGAPPVGFLNPALYQIGMDPTRYPLAFNDINDSANSGPIAGVVSTNPCGFSYPAVAGYDLVTGWGTPRCGLITATAQGCLSACGGVCTNIDTDATNCGVCGHDCQGGACVLGVCQPYVVAGPAGIQDIQDVAFDGNHVVWADNVSGNVSEVTVTGGPPAVIGSIPLATESFTGVGINGGYIAWATAGALDVPPGSEAFNGVVPPLLPSASNDLWIAQDEQPASTMELLEETYSPLFGLVQDPTGNAWFVSDVLTPVGSAPTAEELWIARQAPGQQLWTGTIGLPSWPLAVSAPSAGNTSVYWADSAGGNVWVYSTANAQATIFQSIPSGFTPEQVAVDGSSVYWINLSPPSPSGQTAQIMSAPLGGGAAVAVGLALGSGVNGLASDGTNLYLSIVGPVTGPDNGDTGGTIQYMPVAGGSAQTLYSNPTGRTGRITVANGFVVFPDLNTMTIYAVRSP